MNLFRRWRLYWQHRSPAYRMGKPYFSHKIEIERALHAVEQLILLVEAKAVPCDFGGICLNLTRLDKTLRAVKLTAMLSATWEHPLRNPGCHVYPIRENDPRHPHQVSWDGAAGEQRLSLLKHMRQELHEMLRTAIKA